MNKAELDERILTIFNNEERDRDNLDLFKQLIRDCIEAVTPEELNQDENEDLLGSLYEIGFQRGRNEAVEILQANTKELLG